MSNLTNADLREWGFRLLEHHDYYLDFDGYYSLQLVDSFDHNNEPKCLVVYSGEPLFSVNCDYERNDYWPTEPINYQSWVYFQEQLGELREGATSEFVDLVTGTASLDDALSAIEDKYGDGSQGYNLVAFHGAVARAMHEAHPELPEPKGF